MSQSTLGRPALVLGAILGTVGLALLAYRLMTPPEQPVVVPPDDRLFTPPIRFTDATASSGIAFRHVSGATGRKLLPETMGAGVAVLDFDGDGRPDVFLVNSRAWPGQAAPGGKAVQGLFRNRGDGTFENVTAAYGLDVELYGLGVAVGDIDNDGRPDLFVTAVGGNRLFRNVGGKAFEDITIPSGVGRKSEWPAGGFDDFLKRTDPLSFPSSAAFLDYDGDGKLDLFVCNYLTWSPAHDLGVKAILPGGGRAYVPPQQFTGAQCELYRNIDGKRFENVSATAGIHFTEPVGSDPTPRAVGKALGVVVCDPDGDGWPDLIVANDTVRNFFFHNVAGTGGRRFEETGLVTGLATSDGRPRGCMGIDAGECLPNDYAVVVANFTNEANYLFRRLGTSPLRFADVAAEVGLAGASRYPMKFGAFFCDLDRDGRLDLFSCNGHLEPDIATAQPGQSYPQPAQVFWNTGDPKHLFAAVFADDEGPLPALVGRGCAYLDFDGDGDLDVIVTENNGHARLFRNDTTTANRSVRFHLTGTGPATNRDAIGAEVTIEVGGQTRRWYVSPTRGYLSQSERTATFGVGTAEKIDRVGVKWPGGGKMQEWRDLKPGQTYSLVEGTAEAAKQ